MLNYNRVPLLLDFSINEDFLHGSAHYDTEKYSEETMTFLILKFELLLKQNDGKCELKYR